MAKGVVNKLFETWTHKGVRYLSFAYGDGVLVLDEHKHSYGAWYAVENFKQRLKSDGADALRLARVVRMEVLTDRLEPQT